MASRKFDPDTPLKPSDARTLIRHVLENGELSFSRHAKTEMAADKMVEQDAVNVLRGGDVDPAEMERGECRYRVHTNRFCVVITFDTETLAIVVTAWRKR